MFFLGFNQLANYVLENFQDLLVFELFFKLHHSVDIKVISETPAYSRVTHLAVA